MSKHFFKQTSKFEVKLGNKLTAIEERVTVFFCTATRKPKDCVAITVDTAVELYNMGTRFAPEAKTAIQRYIGN